MQLLSVFQVLVPALPCAPGGHSSTLCWDAFVGRPVRVVDEDTGPSAPCASSFQPLTKAGARLEEELVGRLFAPEGRRAAVAAVWRKCVQPIPILTLTLLNAHVRSLNTQTNSKPSSYSNYSPLSILIVSFSILTHYHLILTPISEPVKNNLADFFRQGGTPPPS